MTTEQENQPYTDVKTMAKWKKKLTKAELNHIQETTNSGTLAQFKRNRAGHLEQIAKGEDEPCWECRGIAQKLGFT